MKVLVVGSGGREHTLVWKLKQSPKVSKIYCAPGNAGIAADAECVNIKADDLEGLCRFAAENAVDLTVVGPEIPLAAGIVDLFEKKGLKIFGPDASAARLEGSKVFSKDFMQKHGVLTATYRTFGEYAAAESFLSSWPSGKPLVVKADGLAAGKGVIICQGASDALAAVRLIMQDKAFGAAGKEVVVEEFLEGEEASLQIFLDGRHFSAMVAAQDHKRIFDNDEGPNTGGMGTYAPAPLVDAALMSKVEEKVIRPVIAGLASEGIDYRGVLYLGLMVSGGEPYVLEFNCRFGDPETQVVLPLLKTDLVDVIEAVIAGTLDKTPVEWYNKAAVCVVLASAGYPGDYEKNRPVDGLADAARMKDVVVFHAGTASKDGRVVTSGGRVFGVTGTGETIAGAIRTAYEAVGKISFDGMQYRKDIGRRALDRG